MTPEEQVYTRSLLLTGELEPRRQTLLRSFCREAMELLQSRLLPNVEAEDCGASFIAAAAMYAAAMLAELGDIDGAERFSVGDFSVSQRSGRSVAQSLMAQAERLMSPYLRFGFQGV